MVFGPCVVSFIAELLNDKLERWVGAGSMLLEYSHIQCEVVDGTIIGSYLLG
jgi:hypothetical protein